MSKKPMDTRLAHREAKRRNRHQGNGLGKFEMQPCDPFEMRCLCQHITGLGWRRRGAIHVRWVTSILSMSAKRELRRMRRRV